MDPASIPLHELLPHGPGAILIERLVAYDPKKSVATVEVRRDSKFFARTGIPAWVGIEYMAQTIAAHVGFEARLRGAVPAIGFLLGTRSYECTAAEFPLGARLSISVEALFKETGFGAFACSIEDDAPLATAIVNTYQPRDDEIALIRARMARC
ncbi:MAG TPA: 3-hydroxylacyl-ACP dehydratase [Gammaproteobacteria bacterium]|nr:3-hydroxylacyl-ACP dehydratase [Gammaproteobacteria bacterium]